eukprot:ANDGO_01441.mRNA.1 hypothetical protein
MIMVPGNKSRSATGSRGHSAGIGRDTPLDDPEYEEAFRAARLQSQLEDLLFASIVCITLIGYHAYFGGVLMIMNTEYLKGFYVFRQSDDSDVSLFVHHDGSVGLFTKPESHEITEFQLSDEIDRVLRFSGDEGTEATVGKLSLYTAQDSVTATLSPSVNPAVSSVSMNFYTKPKGNFSDGLLRESSATGLVEVSSIFDVQSVGTVNGSAYVVGPFTIYGSGRGAVCDYSGDPGCVDFQFVHGEDGGFRIDRINNYYAKDSDLQRSMLIGVSAAGELAFDAVLKVNLESRVNYTISSHYMSVASALFRSVDSHSIFDLYSWNFSTYWSFERELASDSNQASKFTMYADHLRQNLRFRKGTADDLVVFQQPLPASSLAARTPMTMFVYNTPRMVFSQSDKFLSTTKGISTEFGSNTKSSTMFLTTRREERPYVEIASGSSKTTISHNIRDINPFLTRYQFLLTGKPYSATGDFVFETSEDISLGKAFLVKKTVLSIISGSFSSSAYLGSLAQRTVLNSPGNSTLLVLCSHASSPCSVVFFTLWGSFSLKSNASAADGVSSFTVSAIPFGSSSKDVLQYRHSSQDRTLRMSTVNFIVQNVFGDFAKTAITGSSAYVSLAAPLGDAVAILSLNQTDIGYSLGSSNSSLNIELLSRSDPTRSFSHIRVLDRTSVFVHSASCSLAGSISQDPFHTDPLITNRGIFNSTVHVLSGLKFYRDAFSIMTMQKVSPFASTVFNLPSALVLGAASFAVSKSLLVEGVGLMGSSASIIRDLEIRNGSLFFGSASDLRIYVQNSSVIVFNCSVLVKGTLTTDIARFLGVLKVDGTELRIPKDVSAGKTAIIFRSLSASPAVRPALTHSGSELALNASLFRSLRNLKIAKDLVVVGDVQASFSTNPGFGMSFLDSGTETSPPQRTGIFIHLIVGNDGRFIAAYKEGQNGALKTSYCQDSLCRSVKISKIVPDKVVGRIGFWVSRRGFPQIVYAGEDNALRVVTCADYACLTTLPIRKIADCTFGDTISAMIGAHGFPMIAHVGASSTVVTYCSDDLCDTFASTVIDIGKAAYISMAVGPDSFPLIALYFIASSSIKVVKCGDIRCADSSRFRSVAVDGSGTVAGAFVDLKFGNDGLPIMSYQQENALRIVHCRSQDCFTRDLTTVDSNPDGASTGEWTSLQFGVDGIPIVAFYNSAGRNLRFARCRDETCVTGASVVTVDDSGNCGKYVSLILGPDLAPTMAYFDESVSRAKFLHCSNPFCIPYARF